MLFYFTGFHLKKAGVLFVIAKGKNTLHEELINLRHHVMTNDGKAVSETVVGAMS